jgi:hypothetical protein
MSKITRIYLFNVIWDFFARDGLVLPLGHQAHQVGHMDHVLHQLVLREADASQLGWTSNLSPT